MNASLGSRPLRNGRRRAVGPGMKGTRAAARLREPAWGSRLPSQMGKAPSCDGAPQPDETPGAGLSGLGFLLVKGSIWVWRSLWVYSPC